MHASATSSSTPPGARRARGARRRRVAVAVLAGALAFAALTPAALDPAQRELTVASGASGLAPPGCDHARGVPATMVSCEGPMVLYRPYAMN